MSVDKLVDSAQLDSDLTSVANAIRGKTGGSVTLTFPADFVSAINGIPTGGSLETGSQTITATESAQSITMTPSVGYDGFDEVDITVNAIPSNYVGSGITQRSNVDLTASGSVVSVPAGYYPLNYTKSIDGGSATTPTTTITAIPSISFNSSTGLITSSVNTPQNITPTVVAGYVSGGTPGTVTASGSMTKQLTTQAAQTITPTTTNQTISSGRYLTGTQTIKGDANLVAGNIKKDVSIFGVTGTYEGGGGGGGITTTLYTTDGLYTVNFTGSASDLASISASKMSVAVVPIYLDEMAGTFNFTCVSQNGVTAYFFSDVSGAPCLAEFSISSPSSLELYGVYDFFGQSYDAVLDYSGMTVFTAT